MTSTEQQRVEEIAGKLSPKAAKSLADYAWPRASRFLHPAHRRWFLRNGLANEGYSRSIGAWAFWLTPLGLAVRTHLQGQAS